MSLHILRHWSHPTNDNLVCIEVWCDNSNEIFYYEASKVGKKVFV